eukprot:sb/3478934/
MGDCVKHCHVTVLTRPIDFQSLCHVIFSFSLQPSSLSRFSFFFYSRFVCTFFVSQILFFSKGIIVYFFSKIFNKLISSPIGPDRCLRPRISGGKCRN